ncbi:MT-A70-domain-containing protein [Amylostereum chailletii]|nr:MT-A70-domain-containing protein [Amylostereum chailletii]
MTSTVTECLSSANDLLAQHAALVSRVRNAQRLHRRQLRALPSPPTDLLKLPITPSPRPSPSPSPPSSPLLGVARPRPVRPDLPPAKRARAAHYSNYIPEEETIRNDYSQRYVDGGEWPQDWVLGAEPERRFEEYPKQQRLLALKKASVIDYAFPPSYLPLSELSSVQPSKFDVILIDPPFSSSFSWDHLQELPIPQLAADPSFVFLWVGSGAGDGLEKGREVLAKWGYRRCEDVCWLRTNTQSNRGPGTDPPTTSLLTRTKQHCLIGIRGTVRRSTDSWFVHCNVDTDVILWEGDPSDPTLKPPEMYTLIENFCLGIRRLELFGRARTVRRGWVSVLAHGEDSRIDAVLQHAQVEFDRSETPPQTNGFGEDLGLHAAVRWDREAWEAKLREWTQGGKAVVPMTPEIDALRPKSPVRGGAGNMHNMGNPGNMGMMGMGMPGGGYGYDQMQSMGQFMQDGQGGMWEGGMDGMGMSGMDGMDGMGMNMGMGGMNMGMMGMGMGGPGQGQNMGMGNQGQWNGGGY